MIKPLQKRRRRGHWRSSGAAKPRWPRRGRWCGRWPGTTAGRWRRRRRSNWSWFRAVSRLTVLINLKLYVEALRWHCPPLLQRWPLFRSGRSLTRRSPSSTAEPGLQRESRAPESRTHDRLRPLTSCQGIKQLTLFSPPQKRSSSLILSDFYVHCLLRSYQSKHLYI